MPRLTLARIWTPATYNRIARFYDRFFNRLFPLSEAAQRKVVQDLRSGSILDVGCGPGTLLAMARANGLACYGIDTSRGMLERARAKIPDGEFNEASFYDIPYPDGFFDYVVETNAVGGVGIDGRRVLSEMIRVCKVGGEVRLADYAPPPSETWKTGLLKRLGILFGDQPMDFRAYFGELGYAAQVEVIGGQGMYQFFKVRKAPEPAGL